jgi:hypothetical protein
MQSLVIEKGFHDEWPRLIDGGNERKQCLFLLAKVRNADGGEEIGERRSHRLGIVVAAGSAPETPRLDERVVVVVRQRDQGRVALHLPDRSCAEMARSRRDR